MLLIEAKVTDSTHLELARPIAIGRGKRVVIVVVESTEQDSVRREWVEAGTASLAAAYGESEPDYTSAMVSDSNPAYGQ